MKREKIVSLNRVRVLRAVSSLYEENGYWPVAVTDVCQATGLSRSSVHGHLVKLVLEGALEKGPHDGWRPSLEA